MRREPEGLLTGSARLADLTTLEAEALVRGPSPFVVLLPVGSVEPHGPHLPLGTDTDISEAAASIAVGKLALVGVAARVAPSIPYGVTDFARGFAGAVSIPGAALTAFLRTLVDAHLAAGAAHVCLINNHLEPAQDSAVRASIAGMDAARASVACPLTRRWARTLSPEFKSGACHAGRYETSLVLAIGAGRVDQTTMRTLAEVPISLSRGIQAGKTTFAEMEMTRAYAGAPAEATREEGQQQLELLATMVATEVLEAMGRSVET